MNLNRNFKSCPLKKRPIVYILNDYADEPQDLRIKRSKIEEFYTGNILEPLDLSINNSIEDNFLRMNQSRINNNYFNSRSESPLSSVSNDSLISINSISSPSPNIIKYSRFNESAYDSLDYHQQEQQNSTYEWIPNEINDTELWINQYHHEEEEQIQRNHDAFAIHCCNHRNNHSSSTPKPEDLTINSNIPIPALQHGLKVNNFELKKVKIQRTTTNYAKQHSCSKCSKSYSTVAGLSKHIEFHCMKIDGNKAIKYFSCRDCNKNYHSAGALKMHIRTHTLPCKCEICGKSFSRPWLLQGHIRTHTGEKPYSCEQCCRAFSDRSNLRAHQQTHEKIKKFVCNQCWRTFSRKSLLRKHQLDHHPKCFLG